MYGKLFMIALAALGLSACGGGGSSSSSSGSGGSDTVTGLELPSNVSVVTAKDDSQSASSVVLTGVDGQSVAGLVDISTFPADAQISTDKTRTWVWDESTDTLSIVNEILCYIEQTGASDMVNQGAYVALINENKCQQGQNQSSSGSTGQSSSGQATEYNRWTILSTRASSTAPQIVKAWVPGEPNATHPEDAQTILVKMTVTEGVSDTNPFGSFVMNFKGVTDAGNFGGTAGEEMVVMNGTLQTVDNSSGHQFQFVDVGGAAANNMITDFSFEEAANVVLDDVDGNSGSAKARVSETFMDEQNNQQNEAKTYVVNFDQNNFLRGKDADDSNSIEANEQVCTSRTNFNTQVWRYNLYHKADGTFNGNSVTAGQRVVLNSGFPFEYDHDNDAGTRARQGHIGYWGIWVEDEINIPDGATINKVSFQDGTSEAHTVHKAPGKLVRRTANNAGLSKFQGDEFSFWGMHPGTQQSGEYLVVVGDGSTQDDQGGTMGANEFYITKSIVWGENGPEYTDVADANITPSQDGENLWLWSDALGGNVVYVHDTQVSAANRQVTYYAEEFVTPDDATLFGGNATTATLYCYQRCLKGGLTQADVDSANSEQDLFYTDAPDVNTPYAYTADISSGKLVVKDHNDNVVDASGLDMTALGNDWGINTDEMVIDTSGLNSRWDVYGADVSYRWETGPNDWNQMVSVTDSSGNVATFDKPLAFNYTHTLENDANDSNSHVGKTFLLEYGGPGELWGFPWVQVSGTERWHAAVTLANGAELTDGSNTFVVKQIEREQTMQDTQLSDCTGSGLDVAGLLTNLTLPTTDDIGTVSIALSDMPDVTDAPAVIEGEVQ